jgi:uncharacterized protein
MSLKIFENANELIVILKTVERCNINCTYCYYFNGIDQSYKTRPKYLDPNLFNQLALFLKNAVADFGYQSISVGFHGGEPLMQKKDHFDALCTILKNTLQEKLLLTIQTNGMLVDDEWIDLFSKHQVAVGVSLDGTKTHNDLYRLDHKGLRTYDRVIVGLNKLHLAYSENKIPSLGLLCVVNPAFNGLEIYKHFVNDLNIRLIDFILPDFNHDNMAAHTLETGITAEHYGKFLCDALEGWIQDDNPQVYIRILDSAISGLLAKESNLSYFGNMGTATPSITINSDGHIAPDDTFRSAAPLLMQTQFNINNASLKEFMACNNELLSGLDYAIRHIAPSCEECMWKNACGSGSLANRFSTKNLFDNPSVMCGGLKLLFEKLTAFILKSGYPKEKLFKNLVSENNYVN